MPSQDNENAMDGLLRRSLARDSAAAGDCPDAELLSAYFDQSLGADEAAHYELHFSTCPLCREQLAAMVRANTGQQLHPADLALEPALAGARPVAAIALDATRIPSQAKPAAPGTRSERKPPERKSPDARWLDLRWLIPVAAMLVLGTFVFMRFASRETTIGPNQVAISKSAPSPQDQTAPEPEKKASNVATQRKPRLITNHPQRVHLLARDLPYPPPQSPRQIPNRHQQKETKARLPATAQLQGMLPPRLRDHHKALGGGPLLFSRINKSQGQFRAQGFRNIRRPRPSPPRPLQLPN